MTFCGDSAQQRRQRAAVPRSPARRAAPETQASSCCSRSTPDAARPRSPPSTSATCRCRSTRRTCRSSGSDRRIRRRASTTSTASTERPDADLQARSRRRGGRARCSAGSRRWLERRVASHDADDLRGDAAEWIAWHPIQASVTALDRIARDRPQLARAPGSRRSARRSRHAGGGAGADRAGALAAGSRTRGARRSKRWARVPSRTALDALASIARQDADREIQREAVETLGDLRTSAASRC